MNPNVEDQPKEFESAPRLQWEKPAIQKLHVNEAMSGLSDGNYDSADSYS